MMKRIEFFFVMVLAAFVMSGCASFSPEPGQAVFASPEDAAAALKDAVKKNDTARLMEVFGAQGKELVFSGDEKVDADARAWFAKKADENTGIAGAGADGKAFFIELGNDKWPFPVPIAQYDGRYFFHTAAGLDEIVNRRIGQNELNAIKVCRTLVEAQQEYVNIRQVEGKRKEYASRILSEKGKKNGLYWDEEEREMNLCPIGALIVLASPESPMLVRKPYHGYFYKILDSQGSSAPGGAKSYIVDGKMVNGFAFVAYPASYGVSGIKTFIVSKNGIVFDKDLGKGSLRAAEDMKEFNPDHSWAPVRD